MTMYELYELFATPVFIVAIGYILISIWMRSTGGRNGYITIMFFGGWGLFIEMLVLYPKTDGILKLIGTLIVVLCVWFTIGSNSPLRIVKTDHGFSQVNVIDEWEKEHGNKITTVQVEEMNARLQREKADTKVG